MKVRIDLRPAPARPLPERSRNLDRVRLHVARNEDPWWQVLPFVGLALSFLAFPALRVALLGERAKTTMPKIRDWLNRDAWVINEVVLVFFAALTINSLAGG